MPAVIVLLILCAILTVACLLAAIWESNPQRSQQRLIAALRFLRKLAGLPVSYVAILVVLLVHIPLSIVFVTLKVLQGKTATVRVKLSSDA